MRPIPKPEDASAVSTAVSNVTAYDERVLVRLTSVAMLGALLAVVLALVSATAGCTSGCGRDPNEGKPFGGLTIEAHDAYFPIASGPHAVACEQCHTNATTFAEFDCVSCHAADNSTPHEPVATDLLHVTTPDYGYESPKCYSCHARGVQRPIFDHASGRDQCATCHAENAAFHALPVDGFTHPPTFGNDCGACHFSVTDWRSTSVPLDPIADPAANVDVDTLVPLFAGTSIASVSPLVESLPMPMNHFNTQVEPAVMASCASCHADATSFYPGRLHSSLANLFAAEPTQCAECHSASVPSGFVGALATDPPRDPSTGEMRHDAVAWINDAPGTDSLVPLECATCHKPPTQSRASTWAAPDGAGAAALFHQSLDDAALAQPDSCIDCHANTRPSGAAAQFTSANAPIPAGVAFDHGSPLAQTDCTTCHQSSLAGASLTSLSWSDGRFHNAVDPLPSTCLPCHEGQRPTTTADWAQANFAAKPFDFTGNNVGGAGFTHGAGQDCVLCHTTAGTGVFGVNPNWQNGDYGHAAGTVVDNTCIACHSTQRADVADPTSTSRIGFDHATQGTGDCVGCHQATVAAGTFTRLFAANGRLPGGDWAGGVEYPGEFPIGGLDQFITIDEIALIRGGALNLVTSTVTTTDTIYNQMKHTSAALPASLNAGPSSAPNDAVCFHCHTTDGGGNVTSFLGGNYHDSLDTFAATFGGAVTPLPQPTAHCADCHAAPRNIVELTTAANATAKALVPMDHAAVFTAPVTIGGVSVGGVAAMDCATCHTDPGGSFAGGRFHASIGAAVPADCTSCHYPAMAIPTLADVANAPDFAMKHASLEMRTQNCQTCHTTSLAQAAQQPSVASLWSGAALHANVGTANQPRACVECHAASPPASLTQSSVTYALSQGSSTSNGRQWMSHGARNVVGQDCARCHAADASATAVTAGWRTSTPFHANIAAAQINNCVECHGVGAATAPGTNNNAPNALVDSTTTSSAAGDASTGIAAGTKDQIIHSDLNVTARDCNFCHTQTGPASSAPAQGKEWAQAQFHSRFTAGNALAANDTTARCSHCHLNVKPGPSFSVDHSTFTDVAGSVDCASCHAWPGTGSIASPNWLGATGGAPVTIAVGGFIIPVPPASQPNTIESPIPGLPHPDTTTTACTLCHTGGTGGKNALGYDHASPLINGKCSSCHEAGTNLVGTSWNGSIDLAGGAGDSRPFTIGAMTVSTSAYPGRTLDVTVANHFFPVDCYECHDGYEGALSTNTTGAAYTNAWAFPHDQTRMTNPATCEMCHGPGGVLPADLVDDPLAAVSIAAKIPSYSATSIVSFASTTETLTMSMDHLSAQLDPVIMNDCQSCHSEPQTYYPGLFHSSLANLQVANPSSCVDCHVTAEPTGFVGPTATNPARAPSSGEMKHDAVAWNVNRPTSTALVTLECGVCHEAPSETSFSTWGSAKGSGLSGTGPALFHASLTAATLAQPGSCIDCHANTRPSGASATFTHTNAAATIPAGVTFDHAAAVEAQVDCETCHAASSGGAVPYSSWTRGRFHNPGDVDPQTCLPCHDGERPTSTATWTDPTFNDSPFDFVTNASGIKHGDGQDCVMCHVTSGTGQWGIDQNWEGGAFDHGPGTPAQTTCIACHTTQRADRVVANSTALLGFNHATEGTGDCFGCHQSSVTRGAYTNLFNASGTLPGGDWDGGVSYPGDTLVGSQTNFVTLTEINLVRSGALNLVTSTTSVSATLYNEMLHTSTALPAAMNAGPAGNPDDTKCAKCHTNTGGVVTSFIDGQLHSSLTANGFAQPTTQCLDCHVQMHPQHIVEKSASILQPMDHDAAFTASVTIGGRSVTNVAQIECGVCHKSPGNTWADGKYHANIGAAVPADCNVCHYVEMANTTASDVTSGTTFKMKHASAQVTFQNCRTCHAAALARGSQTPLASTQWSGGTLHPNTSPQPSACLDCHAGSKPAASTQGSIVYTLAQGGTATNGAQWMNHAATYVGAADCAKCHAADAKTSGSAWSKAAPFHPVTTSVTTCRECHGLTNGQGTVVGTKNNMPATLTDSTTLTTASSDATTGIPAGTHDQIIHTDVNATAHDCNFCHTQVGASTTAGIQGKEWKQAKFHTSFNAANPLVMNGTTGRCSNCHINVKPGASFSFDHSSYTAATSSTDCSSCHSFPGTGTTTSPNWLGAAGGFPQFIAVGGFVIPKPPAATTGTTQTGIANLPHPTPGATACTACHQSSAGGKNALGYDHASTLANGKCSACHEAGSNLVGTVWNGATAIIGAGDTRPFTLNPLRVTFSGNSLTINSTSCPGGFACGNHFAGVDCYQCHNAPTGLSTTTTSTTFKTKWAFPHRESRMTNPGTCRLCHGNNIPN